MTWSVWLEPVVCFAEPAQSTEPPAETQSEEKKPESPVQAEEPAPEGGQELEDETPADTEPATTAEDTGNQEETQEAES